MTEKKILFLKLIVVILILLLLVITGSPAKEISKGIESVYSQINGEGEKDTNIIILHISANDIERIGPWPIRRSYYALLINSLTKQQVRKIGLEIFLSSRLVTQSIYEDLLRNEILKSGRVVLGSKAGKITESEGKYFTDSLSYPSPKLLDESIATGHLNFYTDDELIIPNEIIYNEITEPSFSQKVSGKFNSTSKIPVNYISSWKKFRNYSITEYFNLLQTNPGSLNHFRDKIIIIGISDEQIAYSFRTPFDEMMPGVALHAFAVDNLLNYRYFSYKFYYLSAIAFVLIVLTITIFHNKLNSRKYLFYSIEFFLFILVTYLIYTSFYLKIAMVYFAVPFLSLVLIDGIFSVINYRKTVKGVLDESEILKVLFQNKQNELSRLQNELDLKTEDGSIQLIEKIKTLKNEINRLKENEEDKSAVELTVNNIENDFYGMIYRSKPMTAVVELIKKAAPTNSTVLIIGESGTGKELAANSIHSLSQRKDKNFVIVNCGALSENLLESELFGHVKGSFTGAISDKQGKFESADNGTIFLDEIGETSENFQVKLLRVLQSGDIEKVGSSSPHKVDVRVIAATNIDLETAVKEKKFREDLYYRLNVFKIELPPLRDRKDDIELLALHFLRKGSYELKFSRAVMNSLINYDWKGNIRELESVINRAGIFAKSSNRELIQISDLPSEIVKTGKYSFEELVLESLRSKNFSHSAIIETAKELGNIGRTTVSENFRGIVMKTLVENNFDVDQAVKTISTNQNDDVNEKVRSKIQTYLANIESDLSKSTFNNFDEVKQKFSSKYKNLPVKFHSYLDEVIKYKLNS